MPTKENRRCKGCGYTVVNDDNVHACPCCDLETCPDCAGHCGCPEVEEG